MTFDHNVNAVVYRATTHMLATTGTFESTKRPNNIIKHGVLTL